MKFPDMTDTNGQPADQCAAKGCTEPRWNQYETLCSRHAVGICLFRSWMSQEMERELAILTRHQQQDQ
jgi:hypothetical protein